MLRLVLVMALPAIAQVNSAYRAEVEQWRRQHEESLKAEWNWLTVTGLFWLRAGEATLGSDSTSDIVLPPTTAARFGTIRLEGTKVTFSPAARNIHLNGKPAAQAVELRANQDILTDGAIQLLLLKRGERFALRLKDNNSPFRRNFKGLKWYPVEDSWRLSGTLVPFPKPVTLTFQTVVGEPAAMESPGVVRFERGGETYQLQPVTEGDKLFFVFRDQTSGKTTYGAVRFLYTPLPKDGKVVLDFNKAENPPCAFTPYATCPLPPPQNRLPLAITAGELKYEGE